MGLGVGICIGIGTCNQKADNRGHFAETGRPLETHQNWSHHSGVSPSQLGWIDYGTTIKFFHNTSSNPSNVMRSGYQETTGVISANYSNAGGTTNWTLPFAKFVDANNLIGARVNDNKIEIVQRKSGVWATLASGGTDLEGLFRVAILADRIEVFVDGVKQLEADHTLPNAGGFGISGHQWASPDATILSGYRVDPVSRFMVTHNGEEVTYGGEAVYRI